MGPGLQLVALGRIFFFFLALLLILFLVCHLLVTDPDFQRRGLGAMLLGHVTELADAENRRIYLEATAAGHPLYEKLGFRDIDLITIDLKKWGEDVTDYNWVMMREPQTKL